MRTMIAAAAALALSTAALAAPGHGHGGPEAAQRGPMGGGSMMGMMQEHCAMMGHTEGALAFLKTELAITPAQNRVWEGFADTYRAAAADKSKMPMSRGEGPMAERPFPEMVARHLEMMENHLDRAKKLTDAAKPLYDALNTEQRKTADELLAHFVMAQCSMMQGS